MEKSYPNILIPRYPGAREYPYSIAENCSAAVFIDEKENVKIADHLNQLAGRKFILKGMLNQVTAKNSIAWIIRSYLGQKHILAVRLERFMESGILQLIKSYLQSAERRKFGKLKLEEITAAEGKPMGLNKKNDTDYFILSEHAFSVHNPDTNISNLWLHSAHVKLVPSQISKILVPVSIVGTAAYDYQDGHMALAYVNVRTGQIIYYDQPTDDIVNFKDIFDSLIECFTFHFPIEAGFSCELGHYPIQKPNECATVILLVAECLNNGTVIPEELSNEDFAAARPRIFEIAQKYDDITSFYD